MVICLRRRSAEAVMNDRRHVSSVAAGPEMFEQGAA
jgi:hypothetical protein